MATILEICAEGLNQLPTPFSCWLRLGDACGVITQGVGSLLLVQEAARAALNVTLEFEGQQFQGVSKELTVGADPVLEQVTVCAESSEERLLSFSVRRIEHCGRCSGIQHVLGHYKVEDTDPEGFMEKINTRLEQSQHLTAENSSIKERLSISNTARDELLRKLEENSRSSQVKFAKLSKKNEKVLRELAECKELLNKEQATATATDFDCQELRRKLCEKDQEVNSLRDKLNRAVESEKSVRRGFAPRPSSNSLSYEDIVRDFEAQSQSQREAIESIQIDKEAILSELASTKHKLEQARSALEASEQDCSKLTTNNTKLQTQLDNLNLKLDKELKKLHSDLEYANFEKEQALNSRETLQEDFECATEKNNALKTQLTLRNKELEQDMGTSTGKLDKLLQENETLKGANTKLRADLTVEASTNNEIQGQLKGYYEDYVKSLNEEIAKRDSEHELKLREITEQFERLTGQNRELLTSLSTAKSTLDQKTKKNQGLARENEQFSQKLAELECLSGIAEDLKLTVKDLKVQNSNLEEDSSALRTQLSSTKTKLAEQLKVNKERQAKLTGLNNSLFEATAEKEKLQAELMAFNCKDKYIPVKVDPVDIALAEYVNNQGIYLKVPFIREDFGIYRFGFKKVYVKIENGVLVLRVGGGFMLIDEFIELYTPTEVDKLAYYSQKVSNSIANISNGTYSPMLFPTENIERLSNEGLKDDLMNGKYTTMFTPKKSTPTTKRFNRLRRTATNIGFPN